METLEEVGEKLAKMYDSGELTQEIIDKHCEKYGVEEDVLDEFFQIAHQKPLKFGQIHSLWYECNPEPSKLKYGETCTIPMESGKIGVYELVDIKWHLSCDWQWYTLKFVGYKKED